MLRKIDLYLAKSFLVRLFQLLLSFSAIIFFINFLDASKKLEGKVDGFIKIALLMGALQIPSFLTEIINSIVMIAGIVTIFLLSSKNEITIIRSSGQSIWRMLAPIAIAAFCFGLLWITAIQFLFVKMTKKYSEIESQYVSNEAREFSVPKDKIWFRQSNLEVKEGELILRAGEVNDKGKFTNVGIWFVDQNGHLYKKIDAHSMVLDGEKWHLSNVIINDENSMNKKLNEINVDTNLSSGFVDKVLINNFKDVKLFNIFELRDLIKDLMNAGFPPAKFKVYLHHLLATPIMFVAMILIACYFGTVNSRNGMALFRVFFGMVCGLLFYIVSRIVVAVGSSEIIPCFVATWLTALMCFSVGILLVYRKDFEG